MKPSPEELQALRHDAFVDEAFRASMRASADAVADWERAHEIAPSALMRAMVCLTRLFPKLSTDREPTRGDRFPLL